MRDRLVRPGVDRAALAGAARDEHDDRACSGQDRVARGGDVRTSSRSSGRTRATRPMPRRSPRRCGGRGWPRAPLSLVPIATPAPLDVRVPHRARARLAGRRAALIRQIGAFRSSAGCGQPAADRHRCRWRRWLGRVPRQPSTGGKAGLWGVARHGTHCRRRQPWSGRMPAVPGGPFGAARGRAERLGAWRRGREARAPANLAPVARAAKPARFPRRASPDARRGADGAAACGGRWAIITRHPSHHATTGAHRLGTTRQGSARQGRVGLPSSSGVAAACRTNWPLQAAGITRPAAR